MKRFKYLFFLIMLLVILLGRHNKVIEAASQPALYIRTDRSYVEPGGSYNLFVLSDYRKFSAYSGYLEVGLNCNADGTSCSDIRQWKDFSGNPIYVKNGAITVNIPADTQPFTASNIRFRPNPNPEIFSWSNPITIGVGETIGLVDTTKYFIMDEDEIIFQGENRSFDTPISFNTVVGFDPESNVCGTLGKVMYFIKDTEYGYWNPQTPWITDNYNGDTGYSKKNLLWPLAYWEQKINWHDNFLTSTGARTYNYHPSLALTRENNFSASELGQQYKFGSLNPALPGYFLTAKFVGNGWGVGNNQQIVGRRWGGDFCSIPYDTNNPSQWSVHTDKTSLPGYSDVLRLKFYEADLGFVTDPTKYALREDWYFAKDVGLIRIDTKNFCPTGWGQYDKCKPCTEDEDCLNEYILNPHTTLSRVGPYMPPAFEGDANGDGKVDGLDYIIWLNNYNQQATNGASAGDFNADGKVDGVDYIIWLNNYQP